MNLFRDRIDAGTKLAAKLDNYQHQADLLILALPRGGVPVAYEVAKALHTPLNLFLVRKLGAPGQEELAIGALAEDGTYFLNQSLLTQFDINQQQLENIIKHEQAELARRLAKYRLNQALPTIQNKTVILIDDGIATGATLMAVIQVLRLKKPKRLILAIPVASQSSLKMLAPLVDEIVCLLTPEPFIGVGQWYLNFTQTTDDEVIALLQKPIKRD